MNTIQLAGRLGADVETRFTPSGQKVSTFRMATNSRRGGQDTTTWWRVTLWGDRWDNMLQYLTKGSAMMVWGELKQPEIYTDRNGQPQVALEVTAEMLKFSPFGKGSDDNRGGSGGGYGQQEQQGGGYQQNQQQGGQQQHQQQPWETAPSPAGTDSDDEVPF